MGVTALSVSKRHARVVVLRLSAMRLNITGLDERPWISAAYLQGGSLVLIWRVPVEARATIRRDALGR